MVKVFEYNEKYTSVNDYEKDNYLTCDIYCELNHIDPTLFLSLSRRPIIYHQQSQ